MAGIGMDSFDRYTNAKLVPGGWDALYGNNGASIAVGRPYLGNRTVTDGAITAGAYILTSATAAFTSADLYRPIVVVGAGPGGDLYCARIKTITNSTTVVMYSPAQTTVTSATTYVSYGTALKLNGAANGCQLVKNLSANYGTLQTGFAFECSALPGGSGESQIFAYLDTGNVQILLTMNSAGSIKIYAGNFTTLLYITAPAVLQAGAYYYIEVGALFATSAIGTVTVNVGMVQVAHVTGVITTTSSNATANQISCDVGQNIINYFDDMYWQDATGSTNNTFRGDQTIGAFVAASDGPTNNFTTSTGSSHYALVNDSSPDDDAGYVYDSTVNDVEYFHMATVPPGVSVTAVQDVAWERKDDSSARATAAAVYDVSSPYVGTTHSLPSNYIYNTQNYDVNPVSAASWTPTIVNGLQYGKKVIS